MDNKKKIHSRLSCKTKAESSIFKDDDYETSKMMLEDIKPFIPNNCKIIYDPFYCKGTIKKFWKELGYECINEKKDAFNWKPKNFDITITNCPFSIKKKSMDLLFELKKPFMLLTTIDSMGCKWIKPYFDKLQFIIPRKRYAFIKDGKQTKSSWFDTCWFCYNCNLDKDIQKL